MSNTPILVTGAAGFIGFHTSLRLLEEGRSVIGLDNLNDYYDPALKQARLRELSRFPAFQFARADLADGTAISDLFNTHQFKRVVHLAAQAGVRHSLIDPHAYANSNLIGFLNILEGCRKSRCDHLIYASSSSVYGSNTAMPYSTNQNVDHPLSLYGATKRANELMAHSYSNLFGIPTTGLRFFTVYGPWGRPDMAIWLFTEAILNARPIKLFNFGKMRRDFTFVDDIVNAISPLILQPATPDANFSTTNPSFNSSTAPWRIYNLGNHSPVDLGEVVKQIENNLGKTAIVELVDMQPGDVPDTYADVDDIRSAVGFSPNTPISVGIKKFIDWYKSYCACSEASSD